MAPVSARWAVHIPRPESGASGVALGGDDLQRAVLLVHGERARPVHHEEEERAYGGHGLEEEVALVVAVEPGVDLRGAWKRV